MTLSPDLVGTDRRDDAGREHRIHEKAAVRIDGPSALRLVREDIERQLFDA